MNLQLNSINDANIIRPVKSLLSEEFFIPKYQRGYRWTERQVLDLLEDVNAFIPETREVDGKLQTTWYCFQPLVVNKNSKRWNLVDGQQRLTTIKLLLMNLNSRFPDDERITPFSLAYETRGSEKEWEAVLSDPAEAKKNIDFWHIYKAYKTIKDWMDSKKKEEGGFKVSTFRENLLERCKFIWYDIGQTAHGMVLEEAVFIRLNIGKIPLTNSELIKALFLNRSNFKNHNATTVTLRQLEIATQWDGMEEELSNNAFWYFINGKTNLICPRINYLFEVISGVKASDGDEYATFRHFNGKFCKDANVARQWSEVHSKYQILREWFNDRFYYHRIGYLLTFGASLSDLLTQYTAPDRLKTGFMSALSDKIKKVINWDGKDNIEKSDGRTKKILLLHNVITMAEHKNDDARFPFDKYHAESWDIEHIQAVADPEKKPRKIEDRKQYLEDAAKFVLDVELKGEIDLFVASVINLNNESDFDLLYGKVVSHFMEKELEFAETDTLSNLALLDAKTNRGYGNDVFPVKRKTILERDQSGQFIPVCTRNVFLKYYTRSDAGDLNRWKMADREAYMEDIKEKLKNF